MTFNSPKSLLPLILILAAAPCALAEYVRLEDGGEAHPDRLMAKLKPGNESLLTPGSALAAVLADNGLSVLQTFSNLPRLLVLSVNTPLPASAIAPDMAIRNHSRLARLKQAQAKAQATGFFEYVEFDFIRRINRAPVDPFFTTNRLWGLRNRGEDGGTPFVDIESEQAWDITVGNKDIVVAVTDTGIRYTHRELVDNMWKNTAETPANGRDDDGNGFKDDIHGIDALVERGGDPMDDDGHGTHVAGTIGARANGGGSLVGVAWDVKLMALRFISASGGGSDSGAILCINYAITHKADVINASWGGPGFSRSLLEAIDRCRIAGIVFVAAAGNESNNNDARPSYPASYGLDNIVSVAAIDRTGNMASFSNYGSSSVDVGAPGVRIWSSTAEDDTSYEALAGTSMAAPHVAGIAALLRAVNRRVSFNDIKRFLAEGATPLPSISGNTVTGALVNAFGALRRQAGLPYTPPTIVVPPPAASPGSPTAADIRQFAVNTRQQYYNIDQPYLAEAYFNFYYGLADFMDLEAQGKSAEARAVYFFRMGNFYWAHRSHYGLYATAWYYLYCQQALGYYFWCYAIGQDAAAPYYYQSYLDLAQNTYLDLSYLGLY